MINKIQMKLLDFGFHSNTDIAKRFKTGARAVVVVDDETKKEFVYTPNRRQRKQLSEAREREVIRSQYERKTKVVRDKFDGRVPLPPTKKQSAFMKFLSKFSGNKKTATA